MVEDMPMPSPLPPDLAELIAARFRLLSEPMRLRIIDRMRTGEASVGALAEELGTSQQNISKHLQTLYGAGILDRRREGNSVIYSLGDAGMVEMCDQVCGGMERHLGDLASTLETIREG
jgi:DNA-binding transcriptional ArsR family regulator